MNIYIDADACPVKDEAIKVAQRHSLPIYIVSNSGMRPRLEPNTHMIKVGAAMDAADDWIAEHCGADDVVVTADILLAQRCLELSARVINPNGKAFDDGNIGSAIAGRSLSSHLREMGEATPNASFSKQDRSRFLQTLENTIQSIKLARANRGL